LAIGAAVEIGRPFCPGFGGDRLAHEQAELAGVHGAPHHPWDARWPNAACADSAAVNASRDQEGRTMKTVDINFIAIGSLWLVVGMLLGISMGAAHNFTLAPLHAHINLIGFVCHSVFSMAYRHWPALKDSPLAPYQFWIFVIATPITLIGLYFTVMNGPELPTIVGSIGVLIGAALFAVMIWTERQRA
jgi:hypothetical protein